MSWSFTEPKRPGVYWLMDACGRRVARKERGAWVTVDRMFRVRTTSSTLYGPRIPEPRPATPKQVGKMLMGHQKATGWKPEGLNTKKGKRNA